MTVSYDANGGTGAPAATTAEVGKVVLSSIQPTRANYTFLGWSSNKAATAATYQPGAVYKESVSITLYAVWQQKYVQITYNANGGTGAPETRKIAMGSKYTLPTTQPTRDGYKFLGWSSEKDAKEAEYTSSTAFTANNDRIFYAIWERVSHTISFNANGGEGAPLTISTDTNEVVLPETRPTRQGYTFLGWSTKQNGKVEYEPGNIIKDVDSLTLYAVWQENTPTPIVDDVENVTENEDDNINDATAVNDGEEDDTFKATVETPSQLPNSGPTEIAILVIAGICVSCGSTYWFMSRRQLKKLQKSVRGHQQNTRRKH